MSANIASLMTLEIEAGQRAVSAAMSYTTQELKRSWRQQIQSAGLGGRLARSIRSKTYPKGGISLNAAGLVWSKAPEVVGVHDAGPLIRSRKGFWLAIPLPAAGRGRGGRRLTPGEWEKKTGLRLRFVYRRGKPALLVADEARINTRGIAMPSRAKTGRNQVSAPIFVLVPQVKLRKRLDLARDANALRAGLPNAIVKSWAHDKLWKEKRKRRPGRR